MEYRWAMNMKKIALGTIAYTFGTFSLAVIWHVVLFEARYQSFGYFEGEPSFVIGFLTILSQVMFLSALFPMVNFAGTGTVRGIRFSLVIGKIYPEKLDR